MRARTVLLITPLLLGLSDQPLEIALFRLDGLAEAVSRYVDIGGSYVASGSLERPV